MEKIVKFNVTAHAYRRIAERGLSVDALKDVIKYHQLKQDQYKGEHGGIVSRFTKIVNSRKLTAVAEVRKGECWIVSGFCED